MSPPRAQRVGRLPRHPGRWLGAEGRRQDGRTAGQVPLAARVHGCLRALRRLHRQVPLFHRHRRPEEHAGGAPGPDALGVSPLLHAARQAVPQAGRRARHDQGRARRLVPLLQPVFRVPPLLGVLPLRHRHRRSHHGGQGNHAQRRSRPQVCERDHRQGAQDRQQPRPARPGAGKHAGRPGRGRAGRHRRRRQVSARRARAPKCCWSRLPPTSSPSRTSTA
jgi:hypothetical protein